MPRPLARFGKWCDLYRQRTKLPITCRMRNPTLLRSFFRRRSWHYDFIKTGFPKGRRKLWVRAVVQRVSRATVEVEGQVVGSIGPGLVVFAAVGREDEDRDLAYLADKLVHLRLFEDAAGQINRSVQEVGGSILAISNFTVYGDCRKGRRPSFTQAAPPDRAEAGFRRWVEYLRSTGVPVAEGCFGARMRVVVENDGPVTVLLDSRKVI